MDLERIEALLDLLSERKIAEFSFEDEEVKLKVKLIGSSPPVLTPQLVSAVAPAPAAPSAAASAASDEGGITVTSPMPGTFYRSPAPDASPFVEVGDRVRVGQVLCIIEAMKMMNELESEFDGVITEILLDNAQPVQFGQDMFKLKKA